jgi:hypothetical protein
MASWALALLLLVQPTACFREYQYVKLANMQAFGLPVPAESVLVSPERVLSWPANHKTCFRMEDYSFNDVILIDESGGLEFYSVADANAPVLNENSKPFPATTIPKKRKKTVYACCNNCDPPYQTSAYSTIFTFKYNILPGAPEVKSFGVYCASGARGKEAPCVCTVPSVPGVSLRCPVGQYRYDCMINYLGSCTNCTNGAGESLESVTYTSAGNPRRNDCAFQCAPGNYFDLVASKCKKCQVCRSGMYTAQPCSQTTARGEISLVCLPYLLSQLFVCANGSAQDTVCMKCPLGFTTSTVNNRNCVPCGFGWRAADDTVGCVECLPWQYTVSPPCRSLCLSFFGGFGVYKQGVRRTPQALQRAKTANRASKRTPQKTRACSVPPESSAVKTCCSASCVPSVLRSRNPGKRYAKCVSTGSRQRRAPLIVPHATRATTQNPLKSTSTSMEKRSGSKAVQSVSRVTSVGFRQTPHSSCGTTGVNGTHSLAKNQDVYSIQ